MSLRDDDRAQAIQIGAVLLFAVLIIVFAIYQAFVIPAQNRKVEFNHNQRVEGDMVDVRNGILAAKAGGVEQYASVTLGTEFPPRLVALNPPPPSGTLRTTSARPVVIEDGGTDVTDTLCPGSDIETRMVEYSPSYAEYTEAGTIRYENTLLYHDFGDQIVRLSGHDLVRGDTLRILPVTNEFNTGGSGTVAIDLKPGKEDVTRRSDLNVTLPTNLSESAWEETLAGDVASGNVTVTTGADGRNLTLDLNGPVSVSCGPVGFDETPPSGARDATTGDINPAGPGDINLQDENLQGNTVDLTFNNSGGTNNVTAAKLSFYQGQGANPPDTAELLNQTGTVTATLEAGGATESLDPKITFPGDALTVISLEFDSNPNPQDWFVLTLEFETGERALYFVDLA